MAIHIEIHLVVWIALVVLIENSQLHIINDLDANRKVNDLRWNFEDFIS